MSQSLWSALCSSASRSPTGGIPITYRLSSSTGRGAVLIRIEGDLEGAATAALRRECRSAGARVQLDLSGLRSADRDGIEALRSLAATGVELAGASPYIGQLLKEGKE